MNKQAFEQTFNTMLTVLKQKNPWTGQMNIKTQVYYECLKGISDDLWAETVQTILITHDFFPTIHEICSAVGDTEMRREGRPQVEDAWVEVLDALRRGKADPISHPDIAKAVSAVGGWDAIGSVSVQYGLSDFQKRFKGYYTQLAENRRRSAVALKIAPATERNILPFPAKKVLPDGRAVQNIT